MKNTLGYRSHRILVLVAAVLLAFLLASCGGCNGCSCGGGPALEPGSTSVRLVNENEISVRAAFSADAVAAHSGGRVYLFELTTGFDVSNLNELGPIAQTGVSEQISFSLPLDNEGASRICSGFFLAFYDEALNVYTPAIERPVYIENPELLAKNTDKLQNYVSLKGIASDSLADAISLGVSHTTVDVYIEKYIIPNGQSGALCHIFEGRSYYFDKSAVDALADKVESYVNANINVFLRVCLGASEDGLSDELSFLLRGEESLGVKTHPLNFENEQTLRAYGAFVDLLADLFAENGAAPSLIVGRAENAMGGTEISSVEAYERALRLSYNIFRSHFAEARVYAAVNSDISSFDVFLTRLASVSKGGGDYPWRIAAEMGPATANSDRLWYGVPNGTLLSPTNMDELTLKIASREDVACNGSGRGVMISDFYIPSSSGDPASVKNQAASYAYTYYAAVKDGCIDALIYGQLYDGKSGEGLVAVNADGSPSSRKDIYSIFAAVDTDKDIGALIGETITGTIWTELYEDSALRDKVGRGRYSEGEVKLAEIEDYDCVPIFTLGSGESFELIELLGDGFLGLNREYNESYLFASFEKGSSEASIVCHSIPADRLAGKYLIIPITVNASSAATYSVELSLVQNEASGEIRSHSSATLLGAGEYSTLVFDISGFTSSKLGTEVTLVLSFGSSVEGAFTVDIDGFYSGNEPPNVVLTVIIIVLCALAAVGATVLLILWFKKNYTIAFGKNKEKDGEKKPESANPAEPAERKEQKSQTFQNFSQRGQTSRMTAQSQRTSSATAQRTAQATAQSTAQRSAVNAESDENQG